jgi:hypothetical protein
MFLNLKDMTLASFARPAEAAEDLFARNMDRKTALGFLALGVCLSTISNYITIPEYLSGTSELEIAISPIVFAVEAQRARIAAGPPCGILVGDDPLAFSAASVLMRGSAGSAS